MKQKLIFLSLIFILFSCSSSENSKKEWVIENTTRIVDEYYEDTLKGSINQTKELQNIMQDRNNDLENRLKNID